MSRTPPLDGTSIAWAVEDLRAQGATYPLPWASVDTAVGNPHRKSFWAWEAACALLETVQAVIGADVAIENTFLVVKWPGSDFAVPWHQDGTDRRIELDPERSVSAWLALTDATTDNGCLYIAPGSHQLGYLPYELEDAHDAVRGRAGQATGFDEREFGEGVPVPVAAGDAILMDVRLLHRSRPNTSTGIRIGMNIRYVAPGATRTRDGSAPVLDPISGTGLVARPPRKLRRSTPVKPLESTETTVTRFRVLTGADADPVRLAGKVPIAKSDCTYYCPDAATAERCIEALRASDERLRSRPEEQMLWDWECTWFQPEQGNPNGGGTVILGVAWFDAEFFDERRDAWFGRMHTKIYADLGIPMDDITVTHWSALTS